mgnify:CR=1 FL=1
MRLERALILRWVQRPRGEVLLNQLPGVVALDHPVGDPAELILEQVGVGDKEQAPHLVVLDEKAERLAGVVLSIEREDGEAADLNLLLAGQGGEHWVVLYAEGLSCTPGAVERYPATGNPAHLSGVIPVLVGEKTAREACEVEVHSAQQLGVAHSALDE